MLKVKYIFQIKCKHVVLAAGAWSKMLAERIGLTIPLKVIKHNYLVTEIIPGVSNLPNVRYYDGGIYLKVKILVYKICESLHHELA